MTVSGCRLVVVFGTRVAPPPEGVGMEMNMPLLLLLLITILFR